MKEYKSIEELRDILLPKDSDFVWGLMCRDCYSCKQRVFKDEDSLREWFLYNELPIPNHFMNKFKKKGSITIYWCSTNIGVRPYCSKPGIGRPNNSRLCKYLDKE